jgi:monoamine oxidase
VKEIRWSQREVRVVSKGTETVVDAAVVAVPASVTGAIAFDPPLPDAKVDALRSVCYGQAAKLFVGLRTPVPPSATLSVQDRFWCYTQLGAGGEPLRFVTAFAGTREALEALDVAGGEERWLHALAQLRPDLDLDPGTALLSTWHEDPWVGGAYSARSVASPLDTSQLARPVGALAFAGEHTAGEWHALMEGAIRSGRRAAHDLLSR